MAEDNAEHIESQAQQSDTEEILKTFPEDLQQSIKSFQHGLVRNILAQHTELRGDEPVIRVTEDRAKWYDKRLKEVLESGFLNPHINPPVEIKEK